MKTITSDSYKAHKTMTNNNKALDESVRNIFSLPQVVDIERQILDLYRNMTHSRGEHRPDKERIKQLLLDRKEMLDKEFVMGVGVSATPFGTQRCLAATVNHVAQENFKNLSCAEKRKYRRRLVRSGEMLLGL